MRRALLTMTLGFLVGCSSLDGGQAGTDTTPLPAVATTTPLATTTPRTVPTTTNIEPTTTTTINPYARPEWLGTRLLPLRPDDFGQIQPTPPGFEDRQFETLDLLPPPPGKEFEATMEPIPPEIQTRSSWTPECPVTLDDLVYLTMSHFGFDGRFHTGEMIVNASVAEDVVEVFQKLQEARFPIEQMRVITAEEIDAHPTGDWNDTTSFVCRPAVGSNSWSQHAFGTAIDISPFHNPYFKGDLVLPELASAYLDRDNVRPGMVVEGDVVTEAFSDIGWGWGGNWNSLKDWMHFSLSGR